MAPLLLNQQTAGNQSSSTGKAEPARGAFSVPHEDDFRTERTLALMMIAAAALYLRVLDPHYSTAYMDESIYVVYGRMFLSGRFESPLDTPLQWSFGWYLWPAMSAMADRIGGIAGVRELASLLGMVTLASVYGFASRMFTKTVGLGTAALFAVLGPAIMVSRIATRDSGAICFFALGLWAYVRAWQENERRSWMAAGLSFLAAFLCKYLVAIYFPFLVLLALRKGKRPLLFFSLPLFLLCATYAAVYARDLAHLLHYGGAYSSLRVSAGQARKIYLSNRPEFCIVAVLSLAAFWRKDLRSRILLLWLGAAILLAFQWKTRADYDYWKHVTYALIFLVPAAVLGLLTIVRQLARSNLAARIWMGVGGVLALAVSIALLGQVLNIENSLFWPNVDPVLAYFEGRLNSANRILVDDSVLRYYFHPMLRQYQMVDPMYFEYQGVTGDTAYHAAVHDGSFDYIILDGGMGQESARMDAAIRPVMSGYALRMSMPDSVLGQKIEIYERQNPSSAIDSTASPSVQITFPSTGALVSTKENAVKVEGITRGAQSGWYLRLEVFTNRWYAEAKTVPVLHDGSFYQMVYLGGQGRQQCYHMLRARLYDQTNHPRAVALNYGIARANPDGSPPSCR